MGWNPVRLARLLVTQALLAAAALCLLTARPASAQIPPAVPAGTFITNAYLTLMMGQDGTLVLYTTATNPTDPNHGLLLGAGGASKIFLRLNGGKPLNNLANPNPNGTSLDTQIGAGTGAWIKPPTVVGNHIEATWQVLVTIANGGVVVPTNPNALDPNSLYCNVDVVLTLVHDTARVAITVTNVSPVISLTAGIAFIQNVDITTQPSANQNQDGPITLSNGLELHSEQTLVGSDIPEYWQAFQQLTAGSATTPGTYHSIRGTVRPHSSAQAEPTVPDRFTYGDFVRLSTDPWNFFVNPTSYFDRPSSLAIDAGIGLFWFERPFQPAQTSTYVTFIGQADATNDFTSPVSLSVTGPIALNYVGTPVTTTKDPITAVVTTTTGPPEAQPKPFTISAFAQNLTDSLPVGGIPIGPINLVLTLPKGLALAANEVSQKSIPTLGAGSENSVSWSVLANNSATGNLQFQVAATTGIGSAKNISRGVEVPALPYHDLVSGFQMISFPFNFTNPSPAALLQLDPSSFDIVKWNPIPSRYELVNALLPGEAYFLRLSTAAHVNIKGALPLDNQVNAATSAFKTTYAQGWNQIGNPNVYGIRFGDIKVFDPSTLTVADIATASDQSHRWILPVAYYYDPVANSYVLLPNFNFTMDPYQGYWIKVLKSGLQFIYPTVTTPNATVTKAVLALGLDQGGRSTLKDWQLGLRAEGPGGADQCTTIGVAAGATDGPDFYKLEKPPVITSRVALDITHNDWKDATRFAQDLRSPSSSAKSWSLQVHSAKPGDQVVVTWPDISQRVPRGVQVTLTDPATGTRVAMRSVSSYTVTTNQAGTHDLQITAVPGGVNVRPTITSFNVTAPGGRASTRSMVIDYTLASTSETQVTIVDARGRTLRTLLPNTRAAASGVQGEAVWDMKDQRGVMMPAGTYTVALTVLGTDGQRSRQVRLVRLDR